MDIKIKCTDKRKAIEEDRNIQIIEMYLRAWNIQQAIADLMGIPRRTISDIINSGEKAHLSDFAKTFNPYICDIWNIAKQDAEKKYSSDSNDLGNSKDIIPRNIEKIAHRSQNSISYELRPMTCFHLNP